MNKLLFGAAYYPEHDPEAEWPIDAKLMQDIGFNVIRVGEFCWSRMQKPDRTLTVDWLERLIEIYDKHGIKTILCTPTATPPVWVVEKFPDMTPILPDGRQGLFGGRRHYSVFHKGYKELCAELVEALAERFGKNQAVCGWHIDNEIGSYSMIDCSETALKAFHRYLEQKFGSVDELNKAWGLIFWNQEIQYFDQIPAPTHMMCTRNPQYIHEYNRFCIKGAAEFAYAQAEIIRKYALPEQWIVASCLPPIQEELFKMQREKNINLLDYVELNNYPELMPQAGENSMHLDITRSLGDKQKFLVLEQQIGSGFTTTGGLDPAVRKFWAINTVARGSLSVCWFHWRRFRTGCEWRLSSVVERDRKPRSVYYSIKSTIHEIRKIEDILLSAQIEPDVQIYMDFDSLLAWDKASEPVFWMEIQLPDAWANRFPMWEKEVRRTIYNPLSSFGLTINFIGPNDIWDISKPLIIPEMDLCTDKKVQKLHDFIENGGTCICFAGVGERNEYAAHQEMPSPGVLGKLFGIELEDYYPLPAGHGAIFDPAVGKMTNEIPPQVDTSAMVVVNNSMIKVDMRHGEILTLRGASAVGIYQGGLYHKHPAITLNHIGKGKVFYIGAVPASPESAMTLYKNIIPDLTTKIVPFRKIKLKHNEKYFAFFLNDKPSSIRLDGQIYDKLSGTKINILGPFSAALAEL